MSLTETVAQLIRWIADLIQQRNWYMLLVLLGVGLALLAHFSRNQLGEIFKSIQPTFSIVLWVVAGLILISTLSIKRHSRVKQTSTQRVAWVL